MARFHRVIRYGSERYGTAQFTFPLSKVGQGSALSMRSRATPTSVGVPSGLKGCRKTNKPSTRKLFLDNGESFVNLRKYRTNVYCPSWTSSIVALGLMCCVLLFHLIDEQATLWQTAMMSWCLRGCHGYHRPAYPPYLLLYDLCIYALSLLS